MTSSEKYNFLNQFKVERCENWIELSVVGESIQIESIQELELLVSVLTDAAEVVLAT